MAVLNVNIVGLEKVLKGIDRESKETQQVIQDEFNGWAETCTTLAKQRAPIDEGKLAGSINPRFGVLSASVTVAVYYAAYVEFGTGRFAGPRVATLPDDWQDFAAKFKGTKIVPGMQPQPFLFPAYEISVKELKDNLKTIFK